MPKPIRVNKVYFPSSEQWGEADVVAIGNNLSTEVLKEAYQKGIFPWPHPGWPLLWFSPDPRGILFFSHYHVPRSLRRRIRKEDLNITCNKAFFEVIRQCAAVARRGQQGTWITEDMIEAYQRLHYFKYAHSVEAWNASGDLVGGLYGVYIDGVFSAESMFHHASDASKLCLYYLVEKLKLQNIKWLDIQMLTPHLKQWGATEIPRSHYLELIEQAHKSDAPRILETLD